MRSHALFSGGAFFEHSSHSVTPRKLQIRQRKVPQLAQGYPSEARSSRPHPRQVIASCSLSSGIEALGGEVVPFDLVDQRCPRDTKLDSGAGPVARVVLEGALDVLALEVFQTERRMPPVSYSWPSAELSRQMLHTHDRLSPAQYEGPLE